VGVRGIDMPAKSVEVEAVARGCKEHLDFRVK
jgi:hypothetical protein